MRAARTNFTMNSDDETRVFSTRMNTQNWLQRAVLFVLAVTIAVVAFFFLTVALIAGAALASIIAVRWWWLTRKLKPQAVDQTFEGEYTVIEHARNDTESQSRGGPR